MTVHTLPIACDLLAITAVVALYFRRHQRRDLVLAYVALNVGVLAVTAMLTNATVGVGLGLGLFGILSIIRLRSDAITQEEIAYYFVALALGLLAGVAAGPDYLAPVLIGLLVLVMYVADNPRLLPRSRRQMLTLDAAVSDEHVLRKHIEARLGIEVRHLIVQELDFVRDLTVVDLRYRVPSRFANATQAQPAAPPTLPEMVDSARSEEQQLAPLVSNGTDGGGVHSNGSHPSSASQNGTRSTGAEPSVSPGG
jgi:hypothetical protein